MLEKQSAQKSGESSCFSSLTLKYSLTLKGLYVLHLYYLKKVFTPVIEGY